VPYRADTDTAVNGACVDMPSLDDRPQRWHLRRNCALGPRPTMMLFVVLCAFKLSIGVAFSIIGYPLVLLFVVIALAGFAIALLVYGRHATDCDTLILSGDRLTVEQHCGQRVMRTELQAAWVRVMAPKEPNDLVALCERQRHVEVGSHVAPQTRKHVAVALQRALDRNRIHRSR
jgi:uncharacterized membrane protein